MFGQGRLQFVRAVPVELQFFRRLSSLRFTGTIKNIEDQVVEQTSSVINSTALYELLHNGNRIVLGHWLATVRSFKVSESWRRADGPAFMR